MDYIPYLQHFYSPFFDSLRVKERKGLIIIQGEKVGSIYAFSFSRHELDSFTNVSSLEEYLEERLANIFRDKDLIGYFRILRESKQ